MQFNNVIITIYVIIISNYKLFDIFNFYFFKHLLGI